jgi:hypothetical protein
MHGLDPEALPSLLLGTMPCPEVGNNSMCVSVCVRKSYTHIKREARREIEREGGERDKGRESMHSCVQERD